MNVLIVEDEASVGKSIARMLSACGYQVANANSAASAIERLESSEFDVVLSDLNLPDTGGRELLEEVRRRFPKVGLILSSGSLDGFEVAEGTALLPKPFSLAQLKNALADATRPGASD